MRIRGDVGIDGTPSPRPDGWCRRPCGPATDRRAERTRGRARGRTVSVSVRCPVSAVSQLIGPTLTPPQPTTAPLRRAASRRAAGAGAATERLPEDGATRARILDFPCVLRFVRASSEKIARSMMFLALRPEASSLMFTALTMFCGRGRACVGFNDSGVEGWMGWK